MMTYWEAINQAINKIHSDIAQQGLVGFKVGDKVRYKKHDIKGEITDRKLECWIINNALMATDDEIELDTTDLVGLGIWPEETDNRVKSKCSCSLRDLMMKGCSKHV